MEIYGEQPENLNNLKNIDNTKLKNLYRFRGEKLPNLLKNPEPNFDKSRKKDFSSVTKLARNIPETILFERVSAGLFSVVGGSNCGDQNSEDLPGVRDRLEQLRGNLTIRKMFPKLNVGDVPEEEFQLFYEVIKDEFPSEEWTNFISWAPVNPPDPTDNPAILARLEVYRSIQSIDREF